MDISKLTHFIYRLFKSSDRPSLCRSLIGMNASVNASSLIMCIMLGFVDFVDYIRSFCFAMCNIRTGESKISKALAQMLVPYHFVIFAKLHTHA